MLVYKKIKLLLSPFAKRKLCLFSLYFNDKIIYFKMFKSEFFFLIDDDSSLSQIIEGSHQEFYGIYIYIYINEMKGVSSTKDKDW